MLSIPCSTITVIERIKCLFLQNKVGKIYPWLGGFNKTTIPLALIWIWDDCSQLKRNPWKINLSSNKGMIDWLKLAFVFPDSDTFALRETLLTIGQNTNRCEREQKSSRCAKPSQSYVNKRAITLFSRYYLSLTKNLFYFILFCPCLVWNFLPDSKGVSSVSEPQDKSFLQDELFSLYSLKQRAAFLQPARLSGRVQTKKKIVPTFDQRA